MRKNSITLFSFLYKVNLVTPFLALYVNQKGGVTHEQFLFALSLFSFTVALFEVPTGFISDRFGERLSIQCSSFLLIASTLCIFIGQYIFFMIGEVLFAFSVCCFSGSFDAYMYKFANEFEEAEYEQILGNSRSVGWLSVSLSALLGSLLARYNLNFLFYATMGTNIGTFVVSLLLPKVSSQIKQTSTSVLLSLKQNLLRNSYVTYWMSATVLYNTSIIVGYFLIQPYLNEVNLASPNNGIIYFIITMSAFLSARTFPWFNRHVENNKFTFFMVLQISLIAVFVIMSSMIDNVMSIIIVLSLFRFLWGLSDPFFTSMLNHYISDEHARASILSVGSLLTSLLQGLTLFCIAGLSLKVSFIILAVMLAVTANLFIILRKKLS